MAELTERQKEVTGALAQWMEKEFGWKKGQPFVGHDDWSMIVRLHAMIETGLNGALMRELDRPALAEVIPKLDTSNTATGKIAFAKALGIIDKNSSVFITQLSRLRNKCVHDIRNFNFDLIHFLTTDEKSNEYTNAINRMVRKETPATCPQEGLLIGTMSVFMELMLHDLKCETRELEARVDRTQAELFRRREESTPKES